MTSQELRRKATELRDKIAKIVAAAEKENREITPDEDSVVKGFRAEITSFENRAAIVAGVEEDSAHSQRSAGRTGQPMDIDATHISGGENEADRNRSFGDFLTHVDRVSDRRTRMEEVEESRDLLGNMYKAEYRKWDDPKRTKEVRNLAMNSGTAGGYLMPQQFYDKLMQVAAPMSIVRPRATVIPVGAESITIPSLDQTTAQAAGSPAWFGGVILTWIGESASIGSTQPGFRQTKLDLCEVTGYCPVGRTLLQKSAISLEPLIYSLFGGAIGWAEDYNFFRGNGVGKPLGIFDAATAARIKTSDRGSSTALSFANATDVWTRVLPECRSRGVWVASQSAEAQVLKMTGTANSVFFPTGVYTPNTDTINAGPSGVMLYMRPVLISSYLPAVDTDGDFGFYDFSKYVIADGGPPEIASSDDYLFRTNERAFRIVHKVGGISWMNNPVTLEDASTTVSPFVSLGIH
jgi:HK97 family phage major capsid protein